LLFLVDLIHSFIIIYAEIKKLGLIPSGRNCLISLPQHAIFTNKIPSSPSLSNKNLNEIKEFLRNQKKHHKEIINTKYNPSSIINEQRETSRYYPCCGGAVRDGYLSDLEKLKLVREALNALDAMNQKYSIKDAQTVLINEEKIIKSQQRRPVYLDEDKIQIIKNNINYLVELEQAIHDDHHPLVVSDKDKMKIITNNLSLLDELEGFYLLELEQAIHDDHHPLVVSDKDTMDDIMDEVITYLDDDTIQTVYDAYLLDMIDDDVIRALF